MRFLPRDFKDKAYFKAEVLYKKKESFVLSLQVPDLDIKGKAVYYSSNSEVIFWPETSRILEENEVDMELLKGFLYNICTKYMDTNTSSVNTNAY